MLLNQTARPRIAAITKIVRCRKLAANLVRLNPDVSWDVFSIGICHRYSMVGGKNWLSPEFYTPADQVPVDPWNQFATDFRPNSTLLHGWPADHPQNQDNIQNSHVAFIDTPRNAHV